MFADKSYDFTLELVDEFTKIFPSIFEPFLGYYRWNGVGF